MPRDDGWPALFSTAFKQSRNAMALVDDQRRHVDVNGAYLTLLGYATDDLIGQPVSRIVVGGPTLSAEEWTDQLARAGSTARASSSGRTAASSRSRGARAPRP